MNKKFSTLLVGALLAGACFNANAIKVTTQEQLDALLKEGSQVLVLPEGDNKLEFGSGTFAIPGKKYLVVNTPNAVITGADGSIVKGRFVLAADGITIKDLNIINESLTKKESETWDWSLYYHKTAISVLADKATIEGNTITCKPSEGANPNALANGISVYPRGKENAYTISGNTIKSSNITTPDMAWSSTAIQLVEGFTAEPADDAYGEIEGVEAYKAPSANADVDVKSILKNNKFENCVIDLADYRVDETDWTSSYDAAQVTPIMKSTVLRASNVEVSEATLNVLESIINGSSANTTLIVNADAGLVNGILGEFDGIADANVAVQCEDAVLLYGDPVVPATDLPVVSVSEDGEVAPVPMDWGGYKQYAADKTPGSTSILVVDGKAVKAFRQDDETVSTISLGTYDKNQSYGPNRAQLYQWSFSTVETTKGVYELRLKDAYGQWLTVGDEYVTVDVAVTKNADGSKYLYKGSESYPKTFVLKAGADFVIINGTELTTNPTFGYTFGVAQIEKALLNASDLLVRYRDYFKMAITYKVDEDNTIDLTGIFEGELTPIQTNAYYSNGYFSYDVAWGNSFMLINKDQDILVINKSEDANISSAAKNHVYPLELVSPKEYFLDQSTDQNYEAVFQFEYVPGVAGKEVGDITNIYVAGHKLGAYKDGKNIILVAADNEVTLSGLTIKLNPLQNVVDPTAWLNKVAYYTVEVINKDKESTGNYGKVLGLNENGGVAFVSASKTDITKPEGQFAVSYDAEYPISWHYENDEMVVDVTAPRYVFVNRENHAELTRIPERLYKTSEANVFVYGNDTLAIKPVTDFTSADGFRRLTAEELNDSTYTIAMNLLDESYLYVTENHADKHRLGLDREAATEWRIEQPTFKMLDRVNDLIKVAADTVTIATPITYWDGEAWRSTVKYDNNGDYNTKYYVPATELKVVTYILKNTANGEYFYGMDGSEEAGNAYYVCDDSKAQATRIALKEVGENTLNLIPAYSTYYDWNDWYQGQSMREDDYVRGYDNSLYLSDWQIIGGTTSATGVLKDVYRFNATTNDLFVIAPTAAPTYKKLAVGDKIVLSRAENPDEVIYEKGEFAGINNIKAYDINPALYVDTAFVDRVGNYKYQYLLGVNITSVDSTEQCNNPAHAGLHTAYTEGRFLVNMADSAVADKDVHTNKYMYDGETKLAFVNALHQNDSLYILDAAGKVESKSEVGNAAEHYAKFAFRMLNEADNEFVIETLLDKGGKNSWRYQTWGGSSVWEPTKGYLRWHNGNLVVTENLEEAEHFTLEATDATPTANEEVAAAEVSVIAQNGAIIVKGAAGKVVTVANILGQTIANQVAASDNVTIAAPAGVAVVTVDGEATKVVVK